MNFVRMKRALPISVLMVAACWCLTTCNPATEGDKIAFEKLTRSWGERYEFHLSREIYWSTKLRPGTNVDENELRRIFDEFAGTRKDTVFIYMNIYDQAGNFVFQLSRSEDGGIAKETKAEHY